MKRQICLILIFTMIFSLLTFMPAFAMDFSDLQGHWGLSYISTLVNDGTINGYPDGTFRPENTVSRAEFVKMIGKGPDKSEVEYIDIQGHWGYDYIMYSGLEVEGNTFLPDTPITRGEVLNLIWKRCGSVKGVVAPSIITNQGTNKDAVAWGYTYGIMSGNDGLHLRLDDTLTRAEGAALIVRAREINENTPKKDFINTVSEDILKSAFNSQILFDKEYDPDATFTVGEMAKAALRFGTRQYNLTYKNITAINELDCEYGKEFFVSRNETLGGTENSAEFVSSNAKINDTVSQMFYNLLKLIETTASYKTDKVSYNDVKYTNNIQKYYLDLACANGIYLYADNIINSDKDITMKEFAAILLQLDSIIGTQASYNADGTGTNESLNLDVAGYPANYADYTALIKSIPIYVYQNAISDAPAKDMYTFASIMKSMFINPIKEMNSTFEAKGVNAEITYYPTLVTNPDGYFVYRVKVKIIDANNVAVSDVFGNKLACADTTLNKNDVLYMDLKIQIPLGDLILLFKDAQIVNIIR